LAQIIVALQREQRISYRALQRRFALGDAYLEDVKEELIYAKRLARDEDGRVLVWTGEPGGVLPLTRDPAVAPERAPVSYTPSHLAEKILTSRAALEGERKQVTVLFADVAEFTAMAARLDPE
jgi:hypothetical protein